jgi:hypothetical protein
MTTRTARSVSRPCAASTCSLKRGAVLFSYPAKGNIPRTLALRDPLLHRVVGSLLRRKGGGEELLAYKVKRDWCDVKTADLNAAVKELAGETTPARTCAPGTRPCWPPSRCRRAPPRSGVPRAARGRKRVVTAR